MPLHPILALDQVIDEYRDYLRTEFRAKDPALKEALERELDQPLFLAQEPFFQAHRPFRAGERWVDLPIDPRLARVMEQRSASPTAYTHQSGAIANLLSSDPRPLVVTTGTGSGKTEAFLLPVLQNAVEDATRFRQSGLTAILVYPMNALANDQFIRISDYLQGSGFAGTVKVAQYDRGTSQTDRDDLRRNPPHILLTNYMMLEYLLVRPADRDGIFANHRCRYVVLDEVHTYRGALGANIALLVRRLRAHLQAARQDWLPQPPAADEARRYPALVPVGTSATIKSVALEGASPAEARAARDQAVQDFFGRLVGVDPASVLVLGEELADVPESPQASYPPRPTTVDPFDPADPRQVQRALCQLAGFSGPADAIAPFNAAARTAILWDLNRWLARAPLSVSQIVQRLRNEVPARRDADPEAVRREVETALLLGAALPDDAPNPLRLRVHRFIRGGWRFHRCVNPACGRLYPMGEERCQQCGHATAPLYICRNCGADYLRFVGDPEPSLLRPSALEAEGPEWLLYEPGRFELPVSVDDELEDEAEETAVRRPPRASGRVLPKQIKKRPVVTGSFDPANLTFSFAQGDYPLQVVLAPARTQCLCCGGTAGSHNVLTPIALGTSAALKVLGEGLIEALHAANQGRPGHDGKERLLIFSDSRQDAAHQARFIIFASRYDRLRRSLMRLLRQEGSLSIQRAVELLGDEGVRQRDNPHAPASGDWLGEDARNRLRAWEEAPLLDDLAVNAGYRATLFNLGLAGVRYQDLERYVQAMGEPLAAQWGVTPEQLAYLCACLLDEMRVRGALSRPLLRYHPAHPAYPDFMRSAEWERRVQRPQGYPCDPAGKPLAYLERNAAPQGLTVHNLWRQPRAGGRGPSTERILRHLLKRYGGGEPAEQAMLDLAQFLVDGGFLLPVDLFPYRDRTKLLQVNAEAVRIALLDEAARQRCNVCGAPRPFAPAGAPCPLCHGSLVPWRDAEIAQNRSVRRMEANRIIPLVAGEHTAQVPHEDRIRLEEDFKARPETAKTNVLACSPTLEMGIDVGGLDAVAMRNIPPRPDNYAQRGGRAGRRARVGLVLGYARSTPHDQYFFDRPAEMIAGEVAAPALPLGNRDVILRHLNAVVFSAAEPGLAGRMVEYVSPTGDLQQEAIDSLIQALKAQFGYALQLATGAFGSDILAAAGLGPAQLQAHLDALPGRVQDVFDRTARQVIELRRALDVFAAELVRSHAGIHAASMIRRLLGIVDQTQGGPDADDRSAGYPLRRLAEFGILPGYEFPTEPASLRLLNDLREEDPITVSRTLGLAQFQPEAQVYARGKRWKVIGLDTASPWNPQSDGPSWPYRICAHCGLRFSADQPRCPRCQHDDPGQPYPAYQFGGFLARQDEAPVLSEEERYATRNLVQTYAQWDGQVVGRWQAGNGWSLRLSRQETVYWLNEGLPPTPKDLQDGLPVLHGDAKGFLLCSACGRILTPPQPEQAPAQGRRQARGSQQAANPFDHWAQCPQILVAPRPLALVAAGQTEVLRLLAPVPGSLTRPEIEPWGRSLAYALHTGLCQHYMLDGAEIGIDLEGPWPDRAGQSGLGLVALSFIDHSLGGAGYLPRAVGDFDRVAQRAIQHLEHANCETACYRCLKSYTNQRHHEVLSWPLAMPYLEALASAAPVARPLQAGDLDDPGPWLEAYAAGVGSPLELKFLRLFEQHGFHPEKQVPIAVTPGGRPITVADFAVPERRLAIYIDGASVHVGQNLRRDRNIRDRLRAAEPAWTVVELRAVDLVDGARLVEQLLHSSHA